MSTRGRPAVPTSTSLTVCVPLVVQALPNTTTRLTVAERYRLIVPA